MNPKTNHSGSPVQSNANESSILSRQKNLVEYFVDTIFDKIQAGTLRPGDKLPTEASMMREFVVSRTVVREALSRLQAYGVVGTRHGVGTFILDIPEQHCTTAPPSPATLRDIIFMMELRISLETEAAALAAMRASQENIETMRTLLKEFSRQAERHEATIATDNKFHTEIAKATGNKYFIQIFKDIECVIPQSRVTNQLDTTSVLEYLVRTNNEHKAIFMAIENKDPESARAAVRVHLCNSRSRLPHTFEKMAQPIGVACGAHFVESGSRPVKCNK